MLNVSDEKKIPLKWIKFSLLTYWGLREREELEKTIKRYDIKEYDLCLNAISKDIDNSNIRKNYIIKFVYWERFYKLPNYIVETKQDIEVLRSILDDAKLLRFSQIWYCENSVDENSMYGRILFNLDELYPRIIKQRIEIVWGKSARVIEKFPDIKETFIAIERSGWNMLYEIAEIHTLNMKDTIIIKTVDRILHDLTRYRKSINSFGEYLQSCRCSSVSIEFIYKSGKISIIDWDSNNDLYVLNCFLNSFRG